MPGRHEESVFQIPTEFPSLDTHEYPCSEKLPYFELMKNLLSIGAVNLKGEDQLIGERHTNLRFATYYEFSEC
jgi:hypothetical protein